MRAQHEPESPSTNEPPGGDGMAGGLWQPERIGRYRVTGELGRGGMGVVYRAEDERLGRAVALKVLPPHLDANEEAKERLLSEARAAAALDHPNVCAVHEVGETDDGRLYLAMACYEGETLEARLRRGPLPIAEAVEIARQIARGLGAAHERGVVHRDLKPSNVLVCADGTARVLDFGIARRVGDAPLKSDGTWGTVEYAAPEQTRGEADARSDVWSLGVVLYEMLAGRRPFRGVYEADLLYAILHGEPEPLRRARPEVPEALEAVVLRCLEKDPDDRFADTAAFERALDATVASARPARGLVVPGGLFSVAVLAGLLAWPALREAVLPLPTERHIAVLPFTVPGDDADARAFADGLADMLTSELTQFERTDRELWVVPYSDVRYRDVKTANDARRAVGASLVVTGAVYRVGGRVRVPLNLVDTRTGRQLRSATLDVAASELGTLPVVTARALRNMLDTELGEGASPTAPTEVASAYEEYLLGLGALRRPVSLNVGDYHRAYTHLERAVGADPLFALAHAHLAEASWDLAMRAADTSWAAGVDSHLDRAVALDPRSSTIFAIRARIRARQGRVEEAQHDATRSVALDPTSDMAYDALARSRAAAGENDAAEAAYREAIRLKPSDWRRHYDLGQFYLRHRRHEEAKTAYLAALQLTPDNDVPYTQLAIVTDIMGDHEEASRLYTHATSLRPHAVTSCGLGHNATYEGRYADAVVHHEQAVVLDSTDGGQWIFLGLAYKAAQHEHGEISYAFRQAVRLLEPLHRLAPKNASISAHLGLSYAGVSEEDRARALFEEIFSGGSENDNLRGRALLAYVLLGATESAIQEAQVMISLGYDREYFELDPLLKPLLDDPRVDAALEQSAPPSL